MLELRKDIFADERDDNLKEIGKPTQRQDMLGHVTATSTHFNDHKLQGMLHLKVLRSPHSHARLRRVDVAEAEKQPGVRRVIRGADVPRNLNTLLSLINFGKDDEPTLAVDKVRYKGEPIVAIVADSEREAFEALAKVRVDYETLPTVFDVEEALKPGAPVVNETYPKNTFTYHDIYDHQKLRFGDVERGFAAADHILEQRYQMSPIEQAHTETNGSIAAPDTNGRYVVYTSTQALFFSLDTCAKILDVPSNTLHFIGGTVGGGFGGKVDTVTEPLAILGAMLTGRPVRYIIGREEEMQYCAPRGAERIFIKDGVSRDGRILARKFRCLFDSGAYTRLSSYAVVKCAAHLPGPYTIPNVSADVYCVFTNRVPATAMRGFGVTAVDFAIECQMDKLAHLVGIDPMEFRLINAYRDGDMKAHRREAKNTALIECVQVAAEKAKWRIRDDFKRMSSLKDAGAPRPMARPPAPPPAREPILVSRPAGQQRTVYDRPAPPAPEPIRPPPRRPPPRTARSGSRQSLAEGEDNMAKLRGRGMSSMNYPIGMNLGGDPSQALVHSNPSGKFTVSLSSIDLGQGMKSVTRQICAETLGVPVEDVYVDTADSDTGPHCMGSFASRGTHRVGNAVMAAAKEARGVMMEAAAEELEVNAADLETDGRGNIHVKGAPHRSISTKDVAIAAQFKQGKTISGRGIFLVPLSAVDPETGEMSPATCYAHACLVAEVEVDDETGEVAMVRMDSAYELGRALNPRMVEQQLVGGAWMGVSHALYETTEPYYPDASHGPRDFVEYLMPGPGDICPHDIAVLERPAADGPFGAKGPGEMCANPVLPAVANAIFNAVGVRVDDLPITPEKVLRAIKGQGGARPQARR